MLKYRYALVAALVVSAASCAAASPDPKSDPLKGVVVGDEVVICVLFKRRAVDAYIHSLRKDRRASGRWCSMSYGSPVRWQIGQGAFWVSHDMGGGVPPRLPSLGGGCLLRIDLDVFFKEEKIFPRVDANFSDNLPPDITTFHAFDPRYFLYFDSLPTGKAKARHFAVTNLTSGFDARNKELEEGKTPACKFYCYLGESRWDEKKGQWKDQPWKHEWSAPAVFKEPFQALALGDDFYFVTRSGSLYRAAKAAKGKDRVLARVWDGKTQPIKAFVSDAKTGKTFLFVPPAAEGGKRAFFELSDKPKLVEYDPKLVPLPPLEEPHRTIVHAARILVALNKIAGKLPAKVGKE